LQKERINKRTQGKYFFEKKRLRPRTSPAWQCTAFAFCGPVPHRWRAERDPDACSGGRRAGPRAHRPTLPRQRIRSGEHGRGPVPRVGKRLHAEPCRPSVAHRAGGRVSHGNDCFLFSSGALALPLLTTGPASSPRRQYCTALLSGGNLGTVLMYYSSCYQMRQWELTLQLEVPAISGH
jgi:hypothetical protein